MAGLSSTYRSLERHAQKLLGLYRELHGKLLDDLLGIAVDNEAHGLLGVDAALVAVEVLATLTSPR